jgi:cytoskeletal protein CcmA (bactofilin family)
MAWGKRNEQEKGSAPNGSGGAAVAELVETPVAKPVESVESSLQCIGKSVQVKGDLTATENVRIDGSFEGSIALTDHRLVVGRTGHVHADVEARSVVVEGEVVGNITAEDRVEVAATGSVLGDICAARVVLAEGARFKGSIDMGPQVVAAMPAPAAEMPADKVESALSSVFDTKS